MESNFVFVDDKSIRYIPNIMTHETNYNAQEILQKNLTLLEEKLNNLYKEFKVYMSPNEKYKLYSNNKKRSDFSMYSGTGGNIYVYWRYLLYIHKKDKDNFQEHLENFRISIETNLKIYEEISKSTNYNSDEESTAFFHGSVGIFTMACIYCLMVADKKTFSNFFDKIANKITNVTSEYSEDEILYGNAGYLYCLLLLKREIKKKNIYSGMCNNSSIDENYDEFKEIINHLIYKTVKFLYFVGKEKKQNYNLNFLIYPFSRNETENDPSSLYLGGAHGLAGILYMILCSLDEIPENFSDELGVEIKNEIKNSLLELSKLQFKSGNFPSSYYGKKYVDRDDKLVHFCHGAPGFVTLYLKAWQFYSDDSFLKIANKCGNVIKERGIIKKGFGVCHGIIGNTYFMHTLFRFTKSIVWYENFVDFLLLNLNKSVIKIIKETDDKQRYVKGIPDTPYSLMEGIGGQICFLAEMLTSYKDDTENHLYFPGFEI